MIFVRIEHDRSSRCFLRALKSLQFGELRVITPEKEVLTFGSTDQDSSVALKAEIRINRPSFWTRVLLSADLGFGEAYMYGDGVFHTSLRSQSLWITLFAVKQWIAMILQHSLK